MTHNITIVICLFIVQEINKKKKKKKKNQIKKIDKIKIKYKSSSIL